eukprot:6400687-Alexandrium_andersonii.AAC.1
MRGHPGTVPGQIWTALATPGCTWVLLNVRGCSSTACLSLPNVIGHRCECPSIVYGAHVSCFWGAVERLWMPRGSLGCPWMYLYMDVVHVLGCSRVSLGVV